MLDFQGAIEDHELGTTHIVRGKDLRASTKRQKFIYDYFDWEYPNIRYWGNVQISGFNAPVSGSTLDKMIKDGELDGWDDVRAPTIRALRKRGFQPKALKNFFVDMGVTENDIEASVETLESSNRELVEKESNRYFFVKEPVELTITGVPENLQAENPLHPDYEDRGSRKPDVDVEDGWTKVFIEEEDLEDGFLRLKGLCNVRVEGKTGEYVPGDHKVAVEKDAEIIHWVPEDADDAEIDLPDGEQIEGRIEPNQIKQGEVVQFERFGFARKSTSEKNKFYYAHN
jgi:glutamyl-tRNA synthetase